jgi:shikimate dehydrogenase
VTRRACIMGHPVAHSRSPMIHGHWLRTHGIDGAYDRRDLAPADFAGFVGSLAVNGYVGGNVTVPLKEAAFAVADHVDETARAIGAVNTLWLEDGRLLATNTDSHGFIANLDQSVPGWDRTCRDAVVFGAGGAARAVLHGLLTRGVDRVSVVNRSRDRAKALADHFGPRIAVVHPNDAISVLGAADLVVNSTSLGMAGQPALDLDLSLVDEATIFADLVYVPLETAFLATARARGNRTVDGLGMLLHQAAPGFARWFGLMPQVTPDLRALVEADIMASQPRDANREPAGG